MLTGGIVEPAVRRLVAGLGDAGVPVLAVGTDTYETVATVGSVRGAIGPASERKIATAIRQFEDNVDHDLLRERLEVSRPTRITPLMFEQVLLERARADRRHIVLPEGNDDRILAAAEQLLLRGVADLTVLGNPDEVTAPRRRARPRPARGAGGRPGHLGRTANGSPRSTPSCASTRASSPCRRST